MERCASVAVAPSPAVGVEPSLAAAVAPNLAVAEVARACCAADAASHHPWAVEAAWGGVGLVAWVQEVEQVGPAVVAVPLEPELGPAEPGVAGLKPLRPPDCPQIPPS